MNISLEQSAQDLLSFNEHLDEFDKLNCQLLAISPDTIESHTAWYRAPLKSNGLDKEVRFALIEDKNLRIAKLYGVYNDVDGQVQRSVFIIDTEGIIRQTISLDLKITFSVPNLLRSIKELHESAGLQINNGLANTEN